MGRERVWHNPSQASGHTTRASLLKGLLRPVSTIKSLARRLLKGGRASTSEPTVPIQPEESGHARQAEHSRLQAILDSLLDPHVVLKPCRDGSGTVVDFRYTEANEAAARYTRLAPDQLIGRTVLELMPGHMASGLLDLYKQVVQTGECLILDNYPYVNELLGDECRYDIRVTSLGDEIICTWRDVTARWEATRQIVASEEAYRLLWMNSIDVVIRLRDDVNIWTSPSVAELFGWKPEEWVGHITADFIHPDDMETVREAIARMERGERIVGRSRLRAKDGSWHWIEVHAGPYRDHEGKIDGQVITFRPIDMEIEAEGRLEHLARTDTLTGLPNRYEVLKQLDRLDRWRERTGQQTALLFCDLDHFKDVNDSNGHLVGDQVPREVAERIRCCLRTDDLAARLAGDELLVLLRGVQDLESAEAIAEKIRRSVEVPMPTSAGNVQITLSIGVTLAKPGEEPYVLLARADAAMYEAKNGGRNRIVTLVTPP